MIVSPLLVFAQNDAAINYQLQKEIEEERLSGAVWSTIDHDTIQTGAVGLKNVNSK